MVYSSNTSASFKAASLARKEARFAATAAFAFL